MFATQKENEVCISLSPRKFPKNSSGLDEVYQPHFVFNISQISSNFASLKFHPVTCCLHGRHPCLIGQACTGGASSNERISPPPHSDQFTLQGDTQSVFFSIGSKLQPVSAHPSINPSSVPFLPVSFVSSTSVTARMHFTRSSSFQSMETIGYIKNYNSILIQDCIFIIISASILCVCYN